MVPSITTNMTKTTLPMISSTDPFLSGPEALVDPNDILDLGSLCYYYPAPQKTGGAQEYGGGGGCGDPTPFHGDELDEFLEKFNSDDGLPFKVNFNDLEEFVSSMQNDYPSLMADNEELSISLPESPLSLEDLASPPVILELPYSFDTGDLPYEESSLPIQIEPPTVEQPIAAPVAIEPPAVEQPKESVNETPVSTSRSGRVVKRRVYQEDSLDDDDDDYRPPARKQTKTKTRSKSPKKAAKRIRIYDEETKRQNMIAARRYREKKRVEQMSIDEIYEIEAEKNDRLKKEMEQLQSEISIMKELLGSVLTPHRIVHV